MGCGASVPNDAVPLVPVGSSSVSCAAGKSDAVLGASKTTQARAHSDIAATPGADASPGDDMLQAVVEKGPLFFDEDNVTMSETADKLLEVVKDIMDDSGPVAAFKNAFIASHEIIHTIANVAIPPPGGQIVGAVLVIAAMIIKGAMNVHACRELGTRLLRLLVVAIKNRESLERASDVERKVLYDFFDMSKRVQEFIKEVIDQSWVIKMISWKSTKEQIESLEIKMKELTEVLQLAASLGTFSILEKSAHEHAQIEQLVADAGGPEQLVNDKVALRRLIEKAPGTDGVQLAMHSQTHEMLQAMQASMAAMVADKDEGPHTLIGNEKVKVMWHTCFGRTETVTWQTFFTVFPSRLPSTSPDEIKVLVSELKDHEDRAKFQLACDTDNDGSVSVLEISEAFKPDVNLLDSVRALKSGELVRKGVHYELPPVPKVFVGRDTEVAAVFSCISGGDSGGRVALVVGQPGEGKATVAVEAMRQVYESGRARGGAWLVCLDGVATKDELLLCVVGGISKVARPTDKDLGNLGIAASLSSRLAEMNQSGTDLLVLFDGCESLSDEHTANVKSVREEFVELVVRIVRDVPKMRLVLTSRLPLDLHNVNAALDEQGHARVTEVKLGQLSDSDCVSLITGIWRKASTGQAHKIMECFGHTPLMLQIIANIIADGRLTLTEVLGSGGMAGLAGKDTIAGAAMGKVETSIMRSLSTLTANMRTQLIKLVMVLPGNFDIKILKSVLDMRLSDGRELVASLRKWNLLSVTSRSNLYRVTPTIREAAHNICKDVDKAKGMGIVLADISPSWLRFVRLCVELALIDFRKYRTSPMSSYNKIVENKGNVQQALRLAVQQYKIAEAYLGDLLALVALLPYLAMVHDGPCVTSACENLAAMASEAVPCDVIGEALCKAVDAHFRPARTQAEQQELVQDGGLLDDVSTSLSGSSDPKAQWVLALALRRKGVVLRDLFLYPESVAALQEAVDLCAVCSLGTDELKVEHIMCLCELSGTLDYMSNMEQGIPAAEQARSLALAFYGDEPHPVTALCLTVLGYHMKNRDHAEALKLHEAALSMRKSVLGLRHTEVAMSMQQCGISLVGLQRYELAEDMFNQSMAIRVDALGSYHPLVANTQRQFADLYRVWGKRAKSQHHLERLLSIAPQIGWASDSKKVLAANKDLADLVSLGGVEDVGT